MTHVLKSPFPYFGGKSRVAHIVWSRFGSVKNYIKPFFGSGAVLLARPDWENKVETVSDLDCYVANFFRALQFAPDEVVRWADHAVNECDLHAKHNWLVNSDTARIFRETMKIDPDYFDTKIAGWWVWGISQWIGSGWCVHPEWRRTNAARAARGVIALDRKRPSLREDKDVRHLHQKLPYLHRYGCGIHQKDLLSRKLPILGNYGVGVHASTRSGDIYEYFDALSTRLRRVRVCCGDWSRITGPAVTICIGTTGVFLDPPYLQSERDKDIYSVESEVSSSVREWALANGDNPQLRIALCGYSGEHEMPENWECVAWKANGGYGAKGNGQGKANSHRERIWFSPNCAHTDLTKGLFAAHNKEAVPL